MSRFSWSFCCQDWKLGQVHLERFQQLLAGVVKKCQELRRRKYEGFWAEVTSEEWLSTARLCFLAEGKGREGLDLREDAHVGGEALHEYFRVVQNCT